MMGGLNSNGAAFDGGEFHEDGQSTTHIKLTNSANVNGSAAGTNGMYCLAFTSIEGYSKFDIFEGNDPSNYETDDNGTFVYCGFKPAFVMYKPIDNTGNWLIFDNKRNKGGTDNYNGNTIWERIYANTNDYQTSATENAIDFLSNGFQIKFNDATLCDTWNEDGNLYIFAAFAAQPFITSKGVPCTAV